MIGGTGNDSYYVDHVGDIIIENSGQGTDTVFSTISYQLGNHLENLTLQGTSAINGTGNTLNNRIRGNSGNNVLNGKAGADTMIGGAGNDFYYVDHVGDTIIENSGQGTDTVFSTISYTLGNHLENLTLQGTSAINGTGNSLNNRIRGNSGNNVLRGGAGNDILDGKAGADTMIGGTGNDSYYVDHVGDIITENSGQGTDTVFSTISYTLGNNLENLTLQGTSAINGTGNSLNNRIRGNSGNNVLNGKAGADRMIGGAGNDFYYVDNLGDTIIENVGEGTDTVFSTITYTLGNNLENLTLQGTSAINGTGNSLNNRIRGNSGNNVLRGGAGNDILDGKAGADTMIGGTGNDSYYVDHVGDIITENSGQGTDTVFSTISYTLGNNLENLTLQGTSAINGTGNTLNNRIRGNSGNNVLNGKAGADRMIGGAGNDFYYVDHVGDTIVENVGQGTDTVFSTISYTLGNNLENLTLQGTSAINGTGNNLNNHIKGNASANILRGGAGNDILDSKAGADTLIGGTGNDKLYLGANDGVVDIVHYAFGNGADTVYQFVRGGGGDQIQFTGITNIDVVTSGTNTLLRLGDGTTGNAGFGTGELLVTLSGTSGFSGTDINVNLFGANFLFS